MTKSNKTLLCCLLTCVMVLACALTLLPIAEPITANAAEKETTIVFSEQELANDDPLNLVIKGISIIGEKGTNSQKLAPRYNTKNKEIRGYTGNTITIKADENISKIVFVGTVTLTSSVGSISTNTWTYDGAVNEIVFTVGKSQTKLTSITITTIAGKTIVPTINGTTIENASTVVNVDGKCDVSLAAADGYVVGKPYTIVLNSFVDKSSAFSVVVNGGEPTILENDGTKEQMTINGTFVEEGLNVVVSEYVVVACDHTELTLVPEVAATCTTAGVKAHYKCANEACGKLFDKNTADKQEVTLASLAIAALGHN